MKFNAYWLNKNSIIPVPNIHIDVVIQNPEKFGYTEDKLREIFKEFNEPYGHEGKAREQIMLNLIQNKGWIRVRYNPRQDKWMVELNKLTSRIKDEVWQFFMLVTGNDLEGEKAIDKAPKYSDITIAELHNISNIKMSSSNVSDVLSFSGLFESIKDKTGMKQITINEYKHNFAALLHELKG